MSVLAMLAGIRDEFAQATEDPGHPFRRRWDEAACQKHRCLLAAVIGHLQRYAGQG